MKPILSIFTLILFSTNCWASSLKVSKTFSDPQYSDLGLSGTWTVNESGYLVTSIQNTNFYGSTTNEYTLGFGSDLNDSNSYYLSGYFRSEPEQVNAMGISLSLTHTLEESWIEDQDTSLTLTAPLSRYASQILGNNNKPVVQQFFSLGISAEISQNLIDELKLSVGGSYFQYTDTNSVQNATQTVEDFTGVMKSGGSGNSNSKRKRKGRRVRVLNPSDNLLSSYGYPLYSFYLGTDWDFLENWGSSYSFSSSTASSTQETSYYSSVGINHSFLENWNAEGELNWSNNGTLTSGLTLKYLW